MFVTLDFIIKSLLIMVIVHWIYILWTRRHLYSFALRFPCQWGLPLVGVIFGILRVNVLIKLRELFHKYKTFTILVWFGPYPVLTTAEPELIEQIFTSTELVNRGYILSKLFTELFGEGLISNTAPKWNHHRKLILPSFGQKVLLKFFDIFNDHSRELIAKFDQLTECAGHDITDILRRTTANISLETTMGSEVTKVADRYYHVDLSKHYHMLVSASMKMMMLISLNLGFIAKKLKAYKSKKAVEKIIKNLIKRKLFDNQTGEYTKLSSHADIDISMRKPQSIFIDQAIQLYKANLFEFSDIIAESNSLVMASFETSASVQFSILIMLAMHPEIQEKLFQEISCEFPVAKECHVIYGHLEKFVYLDMIVNETLRLFPPIPVVTRDTTTDTRLKNGILLPKGLQIAISIYHVQRREDIWGSKASTFNPDNFLHVNIAGRHPYAFIPFSKGHRNCIGRRYAYMSTKVMLCHILLNYKLTTNFKFEQLIVVSNTSLKFDKTPLLKFHRR